VCITFAVLFAATCYGFTVNSRPQASNWVRRMEQQTHVGSHADDSNENYQQRADDNSGALTQCGYHVCFLIERSTNF